MGVVLRGGAEPRRREPGLRVEAPELTLPPSDSRTAAPPSGHGVFAGKGERRLSRGKSRGGLRSPLHSGEKAGRAGRPRCVFKTVFFLRRG